MAQWDCFKVKDGKLFSAYLERDQLQLLRNLAKEKSVEEERCVSICELLRDAINICYKNKKLTNKQKHNDVKRYLSSQMELF